MRLSKKILVEILDELTKNFPDSEFYLFGSQTDKIKKGGDVDLAIKSNLSKIDFENKKNLFLFKMEEKFPELEFDIINLNEPLDDLFYKEIEQTKILINQLAKSADI